MPRKKELGIDLSQSQVNQRNAIALKFKPLAMRLAVDKANYFEEVNETDEYISVALETLVTAATKYIRKYGDKYEENNFSIFAQQSITGALLNYHYRDTINSIDSDMSYTDCITNESSVKLNDSIDLVNAHTGDLSKLQKTVVNMTLDQGLTQVQIASILGVTKQAVSRTLASAAVAIRQHMKDK
jgi:RNA polymerase sigma factor (sigma-70 family)